MRRSGALLVLLLFELLFLAMPLFGANFVDREFEVRQTNDVAYAKDLTLDLYEPAGPQTPKVRPVFMAIHGGGWRRGTKRNDNIVQLCEELARRGWVCASIQYRLTGEIRDAVDDATVALSWIVANAARYRIDPKRIAIGGSSAGAINGLYLAYERHDPNVRAVLSWAGGLGGKQTMLRRGGPPLFLVHGTDDSSIRADEARDLVARARETGLTHEAYVCAGIGHNAPLDRRPGGVSLYDRLAHFLYRNMGLASLATTKPPSMKAWTKSHETVDCPH